MSKLLNVSNYQLLGLFLGIPFILILTVSMLTFLNPGLTLMLIPLSLILWFALYFAWHWTVGVNVYKKVRNHKSLNLAIFKFVFVFMLTYFLISTIEPFITHIDSTIYKILAFLRLIGSFSLLYCIGFIAKAINQVEKKKQVKLKDWIGDMILLTIFPLGIYFLQPRINQIFNTNSDTP